MVRTICILILTMVSSIFANGEDMSHWMAGLADSTAVCRVTIPGSHDSATGNGFSGIIGKLFGKRMARTQELTLEEQWDAGIRAFDLRVAGKNSNLYHGPCRTKLSLSEALEQICEKLAESPSEFAIILLRKEDNGDATQWANNVGSILNESKIATRLVPFRGEMTVGDARGRIIVISRDYCTSTAVGLASGWNHDWRLIRQTGGKICCGDEVTPLYVQDFFDCTADKIVKKKEAIKEMYKCASSVSTSQNIWTINFTSGYTSAASTEGNRKCAAIGSATMLEALNGNIGKTPAGIVFMDFAGKDNSGKHPTNGQQLIDALIRQNYY